MQSPQEQLRNRTKQFAFAVVRLCQKLPRSMDAYVIGKQLLRSGTSVGANYRAAGRARSRAEFIAKIGLVLEEADESAFWLECLAECGIVRADAVDGLRREANELTAIFAASQRTARPYPCSR